MKPHLLLATIFLGASAFSVAAESTVTDSLPLNTRVIPYHVYQEREQARNVVVPHGYKRVWDDDRLNPQRGITTLKPTGPGRYGAVPGGYKSAWSDNRLNISRGQGTEYGNSQSARIWSDTVPRVLLPAAAPQRLYGGETPRKQQQTRLWETR